MKTIQIKCEAKTNIHIDELRPFQGNLKNLSEKNFLKLKNQILQQGFSFPVFVWQNDGSNYLLDGHQRTRVLTKMQEEGYVIPPIPVAIVQADTYKDAKQKLLSATSQYGNIESQGLYEFITEAGIDPGYLLENVSMPEIDLMEFTEEFYEPPSNESTEGDPDAVPDVDQNVHGVNRGDVWVLGNHRLVCGDSTDKEDVDRLMNGDRAIFSFTSPPYSDQRDYRGNLELDPSHLARFLQAPCDLFAVNLGMKRKDNEVETYWDEYIKRAREFGHKLLSWNIWSREGSGFTVGQATAMFAIEHEWVFVFGQRKDLNLTVPNKGSGVVYQGTRREKSGETVKIKPTTTRDCRQLGTILQVNTKSSENHNHPATFPVELPEKYIESCSNVSDIIFEPFTGSGTTLIACETTNRKCYGMEIDPHYCSIIIQRWQDFTGKEAVKL